MFAAPVSVDAIINDLACAARSRKLRGEDSGEYDEYHLRHQKSLIPNKFMNLNEDDYNFRTEEDFSAFYKIVIELCAGIHHHIREFYQIDVNPLPTSNVAKLEFSLTEWIWMFRVAAEYYMLLDPASDDVLYTLIKTTTAKVILPFEEYLLSWEEFETNPDKFAQENRESHNNPHLPAAMSPPWVLDTRLGDIKYIKDAMAANNAQRCDLGCKAEVLYVNDEYPQSILEVVLSSNLDDLAKKPYLWSDNADMILDSDELIFNMTLY